MKKMQNRTGSYTLLDEATAMGWGVFWSVVCLGLLLPLTPVLFPEFEGVTRDATPQGPLLLSRNRGQHCLLQLPKRHLPPPHVC